MQFITNGNYAYATHNRKRIVIDRPTPAVLQRALVDMGYRPNVAVVVAHGAIDSTQARRLAREIGLIR